MARRTFETLLCTFVVGGFLLASAEEKKMGPFIFEIGGIEPRSYMEEGARITYKSVLKHMNPKDKSSQKRLWIDFTANDKIGAIGANITCFSDESGSKKSGHWKKEMEYDVGRVCDADYGVNFFFDCITPKDKFDRTTCGIPEEGTFQVGNWTMDTDLHDALDECKYGWWKCLIRLTDRLIEHTTRYDWSEEKLLLKLTVFGDIRDARKKKKKCKKDDEDCKNKHKKKKDDDEKKNDDDEEEEKND